MTKLSLSKGLVQAAKDHCYDIGRQGMISHTGSDGSSMGERMERYGSWNVAIAENISFSEKTAKDIVLQFIIDDGNLSRGHRKNIMNNNYTAVGVAVGAHSEYDVCCVVDFAVDYDDELARVSQEEQNPMAYTNGYDHTNPYESQMASNIPRIPGHNIARITYDFSVAGSNSHIAPQQVVTMSPQTHCDYRNRQSRNSPKKNQSPAKSSSYRQTEKIDERRFNPE